MPQRTTQPADPSRPVGRPTKYTPSMCETVITLMQDGASKVEVCAELGISHETMRKWQEDESKPEFVAAIKMGQLLSQRWWEQQARTSLRDKEFNAVLWYMNMKNRFGWRDKQDVTTDGKSVQGCVVYLPAEDAAPK